MKKTNHDGVIRPEAWIAVSNNRQKVYDPNKLVYLDQNQEFQIELFNPGDISYLAKIEINGKEISKAGLVIKPGQRYFLDRFIDSNKKLLFSTYEVEKNNTEVEKAIRNNGKISVNFYPETRWGWYGGVSSNTITIPALNWNSTYAARTPNTFLCTGTSTPNNLGWISTQGSGYTTAVSTSFSNSSFTSTSNSANLPIAGSLSQKTKETGRIEEGGKSNQVFFNSNLNFSEVSTYSSDYQILPRSTKPVEVSEIRLYCTQCGGRIKKKTWKFCPSCGEKNQ
jgi:hypothetical protein